ncbi:MFS transporter [Methanoculleus sp. FWC-SCC1]|uniref:MFS transporter n=1 Tax=Methanoculleus frigidifontis TaxID=2584085 RepID=A0ABT8M5U7_9EURY|nr:MFS transporter [Methanoculleus sp. FWC-SCC1]MDN7023312.1 MFS transporter [Methanoculleus sp. FWC-SCC1]
MLQRLSLLLGVFAVMALSNAIVPVLPAFAEGAALQGAIFSAYFFGAFLTVLPAGLASDRIGRVPLIRAGLLLTVASGIAIILFPSGLPMVVARGVEGIAAGLFVSAALAWTNSAEDHEAMSGYFMAALNLGLVVGLLGTGWLDSFAASPLAGVFLFTGIAVAPILMSALLREQSSNTALNANLSGVMRNYIWLYLAAVVLIGVTGAVSALYPEYTGENAALLSIQIGLMNIATIVTILVASRMHVEPVPTIRISAVAMAVAVAGCYVTPWAFPIIGAAAGFVIVASLSFLARTQVRQGVAVGLFNTSTYAGFTLLPFLGGLVAETTSFLASFIVLAIIVASTALTIGRCRCRYRG